MSHRVAHPAKPVRRTVKPEGPNEADSSSCHVDPAIATNTRCRRFWLAHFSDRHPTGYSTSSSLTVTILANLLASSSSVFSTMSAALKIRSGFR